MPSVGKACEQVSGEFGLLFVLAVEPLAHQIRINESIKGLENGNKITKLSLYADDTTAFIRDDSSAASLFTLLDQFGDLSGLKINKSKTKGLWLGQLGRAGLPRCKNLTRFSLFVGFCFAVRYCLKCFCFLCFTSSVSFTGSYTEVKPEEQIRQRRTVWYFVVETIRYCSWNYVPL